MKTIELEIKGMHCASCEKIISAELAELPGVSDIVIKVKEGTGSLNIDETLLNVDQVIAAIKRAGYEATAINQLAGELVTADNIIIKRNEVNANSPFKIKLEISIETNDQAKAVEITSIKKQALVEQIVESSQSASAGRVNLSLTGMHCASCAGLIERAVKKVPGVKQANVNFAAEKALIVFDEATSSVGDLVQAKERQK